MAAEKILVSTRPKANGTSYHPPSKHAYGKEFLEMLRENGKMFVRGPSNRATNAKDLHGSDTNVRTRAQIGSTVCSFLDFKRRDDQHNLTSLNLDAQHVGKEYSYKLTGKKATQLGGPRENQTYTFSQQGKASSSFTLFNDALAKGKHPECHYQLTADNDYEKQLPAEGNSELVKQSVDDSNSLITPHIQRKLMASKAKEKKKAVAKAREEPVLDYQSEACGHHKDVLQMDRLHDQLLAKSSGLESEGTKESARARPDNTAMVASSVASLVASNDQTNPTRRDSKDSNYTYENNQQPGAKRKDLQARGGAGVKRSRLSETHNFCGKERRDKMRRKIRALQELIPRCKKMDKVSVLDDTIEYLKTLQLQLQVLSMGRRLYMPPVNMMLPTTTSMSPQPTQFFTPTTSGMESSNCSSMICGSAHLPCLLVCPAATAGISGNIFQMLGFPWQTPLPMSIPEAPDLIHTMLGNPSTQSDLVPPPSDAIFRDFNPSDVNALRQ